MPKPSSGKPFAVVVLSKTPPLDRLRELMRESPALPALSGERYAATHAQYEAASDQRPRLREWLVRELPPLLTECDPVRVLGVGVGDGSYDAPLAAALAADGRKVDYTGVEPHAPSAERFAERMDALGVRGVAATVFVGKFADHDAGPPADLVHFLHSLYYVADLSAALDQALAMVRPGGLLVAATAPLQPLCVLTELLCPWTEQRPWFAEDVRAEFDMRGFEVRAETLVGHLDLRDALADPQGGGEAVLDFLIGARTAALEPECREQLIQYLGEISLSGRPGVVPHPLDITIARVP